MSSISTLCLSLALIGLIRVEPDSKTQCPTRDAVLASIRDLRTDLRGRSGVLRWRDDGEQVLLDLELSTSPSQRMTRRISGSCEERSTIIALILDRAIAPIAPVPREARGRVGAGVRQSDETPKGGTPKRAKPPPNRTSASPPSVTEESATEKSPTEKSAPEESASEEPSAKETRTSSTTRIGSSEREMETVSSTPTSSIEASRRMLSRGKPWPRPERRDVRAEGSGAEGSGAEVDEGTPPTASAEDEAEPVIEGEPPIEAATPGLTVPRAGEPNGAPNAAESYQLRLYVGPTVILSEKPALGAEASVNLHFPKIPIDAAFAIGTFAPTTYAWNAPSESREASDSISLELSSVHLGGGPSLGWSFGEDWFLGGSLLGIASFTFGQSTGLLEATSTRALRWGAKGAIFLVVDLSPIELRAEGAIRLFSSSTLYSARTATSDAGFEAIPNLDAQLTLGVGWSWPKKL